MAGQARRVRTLAVALATVLAVAATACTPGGPPPVVDPSEVARTSGPPPDPGELTIGVDDIGAGFNPHALADVGPVALAIAGLTLPSPFRQASDGTLRADPTVVESAEVTAQQPFTVTYSLVREASWSDGAPIAAEDFAYLADRMRGEAGVANPAGYRLVTDVVSRSGGKTVDVVFDRPYPGWRTLFANLLPSHVLKDAPGDWPDVLETGVPVSGGPFAMRAIDVDRGLVTLERNDRYWGEPTVLDRIVLREEGADGMTSALATGGDQMAFLRADSIALALLRDRAGELSWASHPEPVGAELLLRPTSPRLADPAVRAAVAAALDVPDLIAVTTGSGPARELPALARTLLPSEPGYAPTVPDGTPAMRADQQDVADRLTAAGYRRVGVSWTRLGEPLRLTVAAPAERAAYVTLATRVVRQLRAAGIDADVVTAPGDELYAQLTTPPVAEPAPPTRERRIATTAPEPTTGGQAQPTERAEPTMGPAPTTEPGDAIEGADIVVAPRPVSGDAAADLASWYGCAEPAQDASAGEDGGPAVASTSPANPVGYCNPSLQSTIDDLLSGASPLGEALPAVEAVLWRDLPTVPLFQHATVLVTGRDVAGVAPGSLLSGPLASAPRWERSPR